MMKRDMFKSRESLSYVWLLSDHGIYGFQWARVPGSKGLCSTGRGIIMRRNRSELSSESYFF